MSRRERQEDESGAIDIAALLLYTCNAVFVLAIFLTAISPLAVLLAALAGVSLWIASIAVMARDA